MVMKKRNKLFGNLLFRLVLFIVIILVLTFLLAFLLSFSLIRFEFVQRETLYPIPIILIFIVSLIMGTILAFVILHIFLKPMVSMYEQTKEISQGNFNLEPIETKSDGEYDEMDAFILSFNHMVKELRSNELLKNDFIANVSHEFKTPLATIEGCATMLQDKDITEVDKTNYIQMICEATREMSSLTSNILRLNKLDNQKIQLQISTFSLDELIRQVILTQEVKWTKKNLDLDLHLEHIDISCDRDLLTEVWFNLISNAIKFNKDGGFLRVYLKQDHHTKNVIIKIADSGVGMTQETMSHIFDKFYQGDVSHNREGNGLGLTLTKKILIILNAKIQVESKVGVGTVFTVTLPNIYTKLENND